MKLPIILASSLTVVALMSACTTAPRSARATTRVPVATTAPLDVRQTMPDISQVRPLHETATEYQLTRQLPPTAAPRGAEAAREDAFTRGTRGMQPGAVTGGPKQELTLPEETTERRPELSIQEPPAEPKREELTAPSLERGR